jgi:hypothetical protein
LRAPFDAKITGTIAQGVTADGRARVTIRGALSGGVRASVRFVLDGSALAGGGIQMERSVANLGTAANPALYHGKVVSLDGTNLRATVQNDAGASLTLDVRLTVDSSTNAVAGSVSARGGI